MALNAPTALSIAGRPNPLNERKRQVLSDVSTQIMDLANDANPGTAPQSLQSAEEIGNAAVQAGVVPVSALPAMNQFLQSVKNQRAKQSPQSLSPEDRKVQDILNPVTTPSTGRFTPATAADPTTPLSLGNARLEQGPGPGEAFRGTATTGEGDKSFSVGLVEKLALRESQNAPLTELQIAQLDKLVSPTALNQIINARNERVSPTLKGPEVTAKQFEDFSRAGVNLGKVNKLSQITPDQWKKLNTFDELEAKTLRDTIAKEKNAASLGARIKTTDLLRMVNPDTLAHPAIGATLGSVQRLQKSGKLIVASPKTIESVRELRGNLAPLMRIRRLSDKLLKASPGGNYVQGLNKMVELGLASSEDVAIFTSLKGALALGMSSALNRGRPNDKDFELVNAMFPKLTDSIETAVPLVDNIIFFVMSRAEASLGLSPLSKEVRDIFLKERFKEGLGTKSRKKRRFTEVFQ
ncbi:hypothetical protein LCGC14_0474580 [marine sediment metagenome]|uniref:Uncharacterized protein n=1 Tax=marine sediment metagenome TaxID=412755 RepID=A0A0F9VK13_9ZZZZ